VTVLGVLLREDAQRAAVVDVRAAK
jgi:hypothetical protein